MNDHSCCEVDNGVHLMAGLPPWMFYFGVAAILVISFAFYFKKESDGGDWRLDLSRLAPVNYLLSRRWLQFAVQVPILLLFLVVLYAGFFGDQRINIAPVLTWTIWWGLLVFVILLLGKFWCFACPWDMVASITSRLRFWRVNREPLTLGLKWPRQARNITLAIGLFIALTWLELGYKVTTSPYATAMMGLIMLLMVVLPAFVFEKKSFCRYGCLVGRISGLYANMAPVEVRARDRQVCLDCKTKDCYVGNDRGYACPTGLNLGTLKENTYCTMCTECFKSCPSDNVALNIRPFASDILHYPKPRTDEAVLAVILLALTAFHGLTMTPLWEDLTGTSPSLIAWLNGVFGLGPLFSFTVGMIAILAVPFLLYQGLSWLSARIEGSGISPWRVLVAFAYSLIPIALFYHLAHNAMHVAMEGQAILPLLSDPFGYGWNLFGTAGQTYAALLGDQTVWATQVLLVLTGHVIGIKVAARAGDRLFGRGGRALWAQTPLLFAMILFSFGSLWIMHLDMNMRTSLM